MTVFVVFILVALAVYVVMAKQQASATPRRGRSTPPLYQGTAVRQAGGTFPLDIVGESHYQVALNSICGGKTEDGHDMLVTANVVPDFDNPYDGNAYRIEVDGKTVGYLARNIAAEFKFLVGDRTITCPGVISGGWKRKGSEGSYGVKLDIDW